MIRRKHVLLGLTALSALFAAAPASAKVCTLWPSTPQAGYENSYIYWVETGGQARSSPSNYSDSAQYNAELYFTELLSQPHSSGTSVGSYFADSMGIKAAKSTWTAYDFGWENWGNPDKAMARTLNGFAVAWSSYSPGPSNWSDRSGPPIKWGLGWIAQIFNEVNDLRGGCSQTKVAYSQWDAFGFGDEYTVVYPLFFYYRNAIQRASTLFHEAFHKRWEDYHSAEDAELTWYSYQQPSIYAWQALYLMSYYYDANVNTYTTYRRWAQYAARDIIATRFMDPTSIPDDIRYF